MEIIFPYSKKRRDFGRHPQFSFQGPETLFESKPNTLRQSKYTSQKTIAESVQAAPEMSEHDVNTDRFVLASRGMLHIEGGWPKDIDPNEPDHLNMFRKKVERDENFLLQLQNRTRDTTAILNQNLSLNIFERYFDDYKDDSSQEPATATIQAVLRDPSPIKRWARSIAWHPDERTKIAVAYSVLKFQSTSADLPITSHIWDLNNPNMPLVDLLPTSALCSLQYNLKDSHVLVGGCYNGLVSLWDLRKGNTPVMTSLIEESHNDPIYKVQWLQSKTGQEFASISSDGTVKWWDMKNMSKPMETMVIMNKLDGTKMGGTAMDYDPSLGPSKFMIGTELGMIISCNRKAKTDLEKQTTPFTGHIGPVYAVQRNPVHSRFFLSVGDWTTRLWIDDLRVPIFSTPFDTTYLTTGCWSPTRPSVFFTAKTDGSLDIWNFITQSKMLSMQVTERKQIGLSSLEIHPSGKLMATGATDGTVYIHELSPTLHVCTSTEKADLLAVLEREAKREKNIDSRLKEQRLKEKQAQNKPDTSSGQTRTLVSSAPGGARIQTPGGDGSGAAAHTAGGAGEGLGELGKLTTEQIDARAGSDTVGDDVVEEDLEPLGGGAGGETAQAALNEDLQPGELDKNELAEIEKEFYEKLGIHKDVPQGEAEQEPPATEREMPQEEQKQEEEGGENPAADGQQEEQPQEEQPQEEPKEEAQPEEAPKKTSFIRSAARFAGEKTGVDVEGALDEQITKAEEKLPES